jgi:hypothetical protein
LFEKIEEYEISEFELQALNNSAAGVKSSFEKLKSL